MIEHKQISILGCGWLGLPLAKYLQKNHYRVKGSTTQNSKLELLKKEGIIPYHLKLTEKKIYGNLEDFLDGSETLIINIPPGIRNHPNKSHFKEIELLIKAVSRSNVKHLLFISSTTIFQDKIEFPVIENETEPTGLSNSARQLIAIEQALKNLNCIKVSILRFAGLFDETRHPGTFLSGKKEIKNADAPINLIHKKDCIKCIAQLLELNIWGVAINAAYPYHPSKQTYYNNYCRRKGLTIPSYKENGPSSGKIVSVSKTEQLLHYRLEVKP